MTLTLDQLHKVQRIISHGNCPDGIASALIAQHAFSGLQATEIEWYVHGTPEAAGIQPRPGDMFLDCSPRPELAQAFIDAGALCIDHHARGSSCKLFVAAGLGVFGDEVENPGASGATLTYEHVWLPLRKDIPEPANDAAIRRLAELGGVRDTWQTKHPEWVAACELAQALRFWPFEELVSLEPRLWTQKFKLGEMLWAKHCAKIEKIIERSYKWTSPKGTRVLFFQGSRNSSDVAEFGEGLADLIIGYDLNYEPDGKLSMVFSTRSHTGYNCAKFAEAHGGGGHTPAAGFKIFYEFEGPNPYVQMQNVLTAYEATL